MAVQQLRLCASTEGGTGLILGRGTEIPYITQCARMCQDVNKSKTKFLKKRENMYVTKISILEI